MDQLWAPWRLAYVAAAKPPMPADACFICQGLAETDDRRNLIVLRSAHSVVLLNKFPYNNGHLLVAPLAHKGHFGDLSDSEILDTTHNLQQMMAILDRTMKPDGYNVGLNLGRVAGAGLP